VRRSGAETHCHIHMLCISVCDILIKRSYNLLPVKHVELETDSVEASVVQVTVKINDAFVLGHCGLEMN
jgi:hypothetical protein